MSSYLWMRKWKILVVDAQDKEALNVSDLHVKFTVKKSREINNYSTVEIYNLTAATEQKILKEGDRIIIEAGYEGYLTTSADGSIQEAKDAEGNTQEKQYGVIFDGKIIYPSRRKENNTDYVLSLLCVDGANVLGKNFIAKTLNKGVNQRQILDAVCEKSKTRKRESRSPSAPLRESTHVCVESSPMPWRAAFWITIRPGGPTAMRGRRKRR